MLTFFFGQVGSRSREAAGSRLRKVLHLLRPRLPGIRLVHAVQQVALPLGVVPPRVWVNALELVDLQRLPQSSLQLWVW